MLKFFKIKNIFSRRVSKKRTSGFTLVETLVSLAVFSLIIGSVLAIFTSAIKSQRRILSEQQLIDQTSYFIEYIGRSIRMAQKDTAGSCANSGSNYKTNAAGSEIIFLDYENRCRIFYFDAASSTIKVQRSNTASAYFQNVQAYELFSGNFTVELFKITGSGWGQNDLIQPSVTLYFLVTGKDGIKIQSQTTISQRNMDIIY